MAVTWRRAEVRDIWAISAVWSKRHFALGQESLDSGELVALSHPAGKACWGARQASFKGKCLSEEMTQKVFSDPTHWSDIRLTKEAPGHPDFCHKKAKQALVSTSVQGTLGWLAATQGDLELATCRKLCEDGQVTEAVNALNNLVQQGRHVPYNLFYCVLKNCIAKRDLVLGRRIHALSVTSGYEGNTFLATHFIALYASHGRLAEAMRVFSKLTVPDAYNWASIIFAYARQGAPTRAIKLYRDMQRSNVKASNHVFVAVLNACASARDLAAGKEVHADVCASEVKASIFVHNCLIDMYGKCGSLEDARRVFDMLPQKDVVTWNAMIAGYVQQGMAQEAISLYGSMQEKGMTPPNPVTFASLLQACTSVGVPALHLGKQLHAQIEQLGVQADVVLENSLVNMYAKCGSVEDAQKVFDRLTRKNVVTWTAMMAGYAQQGMGHKALTLYSKMQQEGITAPDSVTFVCLLQACASIAALHEGQQLHAQIEKRGLQANVVVGASLVNMYAKCGKLDHAHRVFDRLPRKDVVTWNAMMTGYGQQGLGEEVLSLFSCMQEHGTSPPNSVTFACVLQACAGMGGSGLDRGKQLHAKIEELGMQADVVVGTSLVNMYAKCGSLEDAQRVFHRLPKKDAVTFVCLLQACASAAALPLGKQLHAQIEGQGLLPANMIVGNSLVNMYAKCGSLGDAQQVFDSLPERGIAAWGALIAGYAHQGDCEVVFDLFDRMRQEGILPNGMTFLSVLAVCSHVGLVDRGWEYFEAMTTDYGISPTIEHYTCMVDLLGRAGHLNQALHMAKTMPIQPNAAVWLTLLGACRKWGNVQVGREAFEFALRLDETDAAAYVLMSNIYVGAQMWEEAKVMQTKRVNCGARKDPGQTWWTDTGGVVHSFLVMKHPGLYQRVLQSKDSKRGVTCR